MNVHTPKLSYLFMLFVLTDQADTVTLHIFQYHYFKMISVLHVLDTTAKVKNDDDSQVVVLGIWDICHIWGGIIVPGKGSWHLTLHLEIHLFPVEQLYHIKMQK